MVGKLLDSSCLVQLSKGDVSLLIELVKSFLEVLVLHLNVSWLLHFRRVVKIHLNGLLGFKTTSPSFLLYTIDH